MKIKFYLLWFENEPDWVDGKIPDVKEIIEENGFEWVEPTICKNEKKFKGDYDDYDIILMDYKLVDGKKPGQSGGDIITKIRKEGSFTNILFYSQDGETVLRQEIANKNLDGVFCADRSEFIDMFEKLFLVNIRKIEDVNNLRGLVMAETADLESIKDEIIALYDLADCSKKKSITKKLIKEISDANNSKRGFLDSKDENTALKELLDLLDLYRKSMIVHRINKRAKPVTSFKHSEFDRDIIKKRNLLAHVKEDRDATSKKIFLRSEKNGEVLTFSHEEAKKIRTDISKYKKELEKLKESLT